MAETFTFTIKPITDLSDVRANVGEIQRAFSKLKLPPKLGVNLNNELHNFIKAYDKFTEKQDKGIKNNSDVSSLMKASDSMLSSYKKISEIMKQLDDSTIASVFKLEGEEIEEFQQKLTTALQNLSKYQSELDNFKFKGTDKILDDISKLEKKTRSTNVKGYLTNLKIGIEKEDFDHAKNAIDELKAAANSPDIKLSSNTKSSINELVAAVEPSITKFMSLREKAEKAGEAIKEIDGKSVKTFGKYVEQGNEALEKNAINAEKAAKAEANLNKQVSHLEGQIESYFGLNAIFRTVANMAREAMQTVKELDAAMTETAVVTNFSVSDMWNMLPTYTAEANKLGSSIKDVYEATTLYYQQGLNTTQSMGLAVETLKMARIAGMDAKDATDAMTAALRGFNLELNQASAQRINDVYSELAAITASDTQEISTAMEKVASLAHNAGMEVETTSAFLAQMIETTREAPENLGTALKTVIARFQEMKEDPTKLVDSEGVMLDANKVDKALKSIGVNLMDTNGQFRKLDDVFLEIAGRWDTLSMGQQRYIATMAAGSRQQSRFIAMMSNYSRTMELVDAAYDASGASQRQFEKTLESMEAKLNKLKNAWDQFTMGLMNNEILKFIVDTGTTLLTTVNNIIDAISKIPPQPFEGVTKSLVTLIATFGGLNAASKLLHGGLNAGVKWFKGDSDQGFFTSILTSKKTTQVSEAKGKMDADAYKRAYKASFSELPSIMQQTLTSSLSWNQVASIAGNGTKAQQEALRQYMQEAISKEELALALNLKLDDAGDFIANIEGIDSVSGQLAATMSNAGAKLQAFGSILQNTPLAPFGIVVSKLGTAFIGLNKILTVTKGQILANGVAAETSAVGFSALGIKLKALGAALKTLALGLKSFLLANPIILGIIAAVAVIGGVVAIVAKDLAKYDKQLEDSKEAAIQASDAYDSLKQSVTELDNAISNLNDYKTSFDGLVAGTDAFNEKLIENNKLIADLLSQYDILNGYVTTSETGVMSIDEEGIKALKQQQQELLSQASAISILSASDVTRQELEKQQRELYGKWVGNELAASYAQNGIHSAEYNAIQKEIESSTQAAQNAAINTLLSTQQLQNEGTAKILQSNYEKYKAAAEKMAKEATDDQKRDAYAQTYGYTRDGKKYYDQDGNEVENIEDDTVLNSYVQIKIAEQLDVDASKVDKTLTEVSHNLSNIMDESFRDSNDFLADILSRDADTNHELLEKISDNPKMLADLIHDMTDEQVAALLGVDVDIVSQQSEKFKNELGEKIISDAQEIARTQAAVTGGLSTKLARARGYNPQDFNPIVGGRRYGSAQGNSNKIVDRNGKAFKNIQKDISKLTYQQQATVNKITDSLEKNVGPTAMSAFLTNAIDAYQLDEGKYAEQLNDIFENADFDSALGRARAYDQLENTDFGIEDSETAEKIKNISKATKKASKDVNVLGDAFLEVYSSADFSELLTDLDKFKNDAGQLDANSIREMAEQSASLDKFLGLSSVSASGLARLLTGFQATGISAVDESTLKLLSSFNQLDEMVENVHEHISNFKGGLDTGEAEDFAKENYEKIKEYWDNGEYGNLDLHARVQEVVGLDAWTEKLNAKKGDFEKTIHEFMPLLEQSAEGLYQNWANLANGISGYGRSITDKVQNANTELGTNISVGWNANGGIDLNTNGATSEKIIDWIQKVYDVSENYAQMMLDDFMNYSGDIRAEIATNNWNAGVEQYAEDHTIGDNIVITSDQLELLAASIGKSTEQLQEDLAQAGHKAVEVFDLETDGLEKYANLFEGKSIEDWLGYNQDRNNDGTADHMYDISNAISDMQSNGIDLANAQQTLFDQISDQATVLYNGHEIQLDTIKSAEELADKMAEINDVAQYDPVFEAFTDAATNFGQEAAKTLKEYLSTEEHIGESGKPHGGGHPASIDNNVEVPEDTNVDYTLTLKKDAQWDSTIDNSKQDVISLNEEIDKIEKQRTAKLDSSAFTTASVKFNSFINNLTTASQKTWTIRAQVLKTDKENGGLATGIHNRISSIGFYTGSAAKGRKGKIGPKGHGGMTLTGEEGYEIAWLPDESRSMILGARGPQMADLPANAVVWNHEQSKKIVKQRGINLGSAGTGYKGKKGINVISKKTTTSNGGTVTVVVKQVDESTKKTTDWNAIEMKRYNLGVQINALTQKIQDKVSYIDKLGSKIGTTFEQMKKATEEEVNLRKRENRKQEKLRSGYEDSLEKLDNGSRTLTIGLQKLDKSNPEVKTKKKNGKTIKTKTYKYTTEDTKVNVGDFIKTDSNGNYIVDRKAIKDKYKNKADQEAVFNAVKGELDRLTSGLSDATNKIKENEEAIEQANQKLADWEPNLPYENFERSSLERWNREQKLNKIAESIADKAEALDETLSDITSSWEDILKASKEQAKEIARGQKAAENQRKSYAEEGNLFIAGERTVYADYETSSGASKHVKIDPSQFMIGNAEKGFKISRADLVDWMKNAVDEDGNKIDFGTGEHFLANMHSIAQTVMDEAGRISDGWNEANDSVKDFQKQQKDLNKQIAEAFTGWKNELTQIYLLTSQIANIEAATKINQTQQKSLTNQIALGIISMSNGLEQMRGIADGYINLLEQSKDSKIQELEAQREELLKSASSQDEVLKVVGIMDHLAELRAAGVDSAEIAVYEGLLKEAQQEATIAKYAEGLINVANDENGNPVVTLDDEAWKIFDENPLIPTDVKKAVQDLIKEMISSGKGLQDLTNGVLDLDVQIQELQKQSDKTLADFEKELASALEAQVQKEIDSMESLDQSLDNAAQSILEQARQTLDTRRQANQNQQTETDINNKEQRLAALRANTAGGNQVEIAQLEKEIAQDRQAYQESLEDQLLDRISKQYDDAKKQREIQIQIAKQQLEFDKNQGKFMEQADKMIRDIENKQVQEDIKKLLGGETLGEFGIKVQDEEFNAKISSAVTALETLAKIDEDREKGTIEEGGIPTETPETSTKLSPEEANKRIENIVDEKVKAVEADEKAKKELEEAKTAEEKAISNFEEAQEEKIKADHAYEAAKKEYEKLKKLGGSAKAISKAEAVMNEAKSAAKAAGIKLTSLEKSKKEATAEREKAQTTQKETAATRETALTNAKEAWKENSLTGETHARGKLNQLPYGELKKGKGQITRLKEGLNDLIDDGLLTGVKKLNDEDTYGKASHAAVKALQAAMEVPQTGIWDKATAQKLKHHAQFKYYRTGGLATSTGPAWLDGTASKPELVLNAVDTKNFIALKDILREVMRDISHVGASNDITNMAPTEFNININVDKIANDYDVDKLAARIKKDIVKDASYRNVTSIRHLR